MVLRTKQHLRSVVMHLKRRARPLLHASGPILGLRAGGSGYVRIASLMSASVTSFVIMYMEILLMLAKPPFACSRVQKPQA
jgi:hypothetical protein